MNQRIDSPWVVRFTNAAIGYVQYKGVRQLQHMEAPEKSEHVGWCAVIGYAQSLVATAAYSYVDPSDLQEGVGCDESDMFDIRERLTDLWEMCGGDGADFHARVGRRVDEYHE